MNILQTFMADARAQVRPIIDEEFTVVGQAPAVVYFGAFGTPQLMPVMTDVGYQDHLITPVTALLTQPNGAFPDLSTFAHTKTLTRTQTGRPFFVQMVDFTDPWKVTFLCTDRSLGT